MASQTGEGGTTTTAPARDEPAPSPALAYQPGLDGMRALGMTSMLLFHAQISWGRGAFLALSQFFTLSGFLVTTVLLKRVAVDGGVPLRTFWLRRVRRLWPASIAALGLISVFAMTVATGAQRDALGGQVLAAAANVANWAFILRDTSYVEQFAAPSPVQHFWSLSVEEQFYVVLPLALGAYFHRRRSLRRLQWLVVGALAATTAWTASVHASGASVDRVYYGTDTRMAEILVGVLLAVVLARRGLPTSPRVRRVIAWGGAAGYAASVWMSTTVALEDGPLWAGGIVVFAGVTALVIAGILVDEGPLRLLGAAPLAAMGRITYGLYLYHLPVFLWLTPARTGLQVVPLLALRVAVTFALAIASYHLLERPILEGRALTRGRSRFAVGPVALACVVGATLVVSGRGSDDPLDVLRERPAAAPGRQVVDPVLDVLVVTDGTDGTEEALVEHLSTVADSDDGLLVSTVGWECGTVVPFGSRSICERWRETWAGAVAEHDPDVVLLVRGDWRRAEVGEAAGLPEGATDDEVVAATQEVLDAGLDVLSADGATIVWSPPGARLTEGRDLPFRRAMGALVRTRSDLRVAAWRPRLPASAAEEDLDRAADVVLTALHTHRRRPVGQVPRVMVVGDSQAGLLGHGLEQLAAAQGGMQVWTVAAAGCGLVTEGPVVDVLTEEEVDMPEVCSEALATWPAAVREFDPDLVVVLSSVRDVQDRRLAPDGPFLSLGDEELDAHLVDVYVDAVDVLSAGGGTVVWMEPPCVRYQDPDGSGMVDVGPERIAHLRDGILPDVQAARPGAVDLYPLDELLCPGERFLESTDGIDDVRPDGVHLSEVAAVWVAEELYADVIAGA